MTNYSITKIPNKRIINMCCSYLSYCKIGIYLKFGIWLLEFLIIGRLLWHIKKREVVLGTAGIAQGSAWVSNDSADNGCRQGIS